MIIYVDLETPSAPPDCCPPPTKGCLWSSSWSTRGRRPGTSATRRCNARRCRPPSARPPVSSFDSPSSSTSTHIKRKIWPWKEQFLNIVYNLIAKGNAQIKTGKPSHLPVLRWGCWEPCCAPFSSKGKAQRRVRTCSCASGDSLYSDLQE